MWRRLICLLNSKYKQRTPRRPPRKNSRRDLSVRHAGPWAVRISVDVFAVLVRVSVVAWFVSCHQ